MIHRVDAELAADEVTAIPHDLAIDGIDEALVIHLGWDSVDTLEPWPVVGVWSSSCTLRWRRRRSSGRSPG